MNGCIRHCVLKGGCLSYADLHSVLNLLKQPKKCLNNSCVNSGDEKSAASVASWWLRLTVADPHRLSLIHADLGLRLLTVVAYLLVHAACGHGRHLGQAMCMRMSAQRLIEGRVLRMRMPSMPSRLLGCVRLCSSAMTEQLPSTLSHASGCQLCLCQRLSDNRSASSTRV